MPERSATTTLPSAILEQIVTICRHHQAELIDHVVRGRAGARILELYIDSVGSVTHQLCEQISRNVEELIADDANLDDIVRLDVSSPGVERPLRFPWQYHKHNGRLLSITTNDGQHFLGRLRSSSETAIVLDCDEDIATLPFSRIALSYVQVEW